MRGGGGRFTLTQVVPLSDSLSNFRQQHSGIFQEKVHSVAVPITLSVC